MEALPDLVNVSLPNPKTLLAFDFDDTLIASNSDTYVFKLCPNGRVPEHIESTYSDKGWVTFMNNIFECLHQSGVTAAQILSCIAEIPLVEGMAAIFDEVKETNRYHVVIISDANSVFINHIMESKGLRGAIKEVHTNPAAFDTNGQLRVQPYHDQDWCQLSSRNLCKGHILDTFLEKQKKLGVVYERVAYVGDGKNDFCPGLRLSNKDLLFPRTGYKLLQTINKNSKDHVLKAKVLPWSSGSDILKALCDYN